MSGFIQRSDSQVIIGADNSTVPLMYICQFSGRFLYNVFNNFVRDHIFAKMNSCKFPLEM